MDIWPTNFAKEIIDAKNERAARTGGIE